MPWLMRTPEAGKSVFSMGEMSYCIASKNDSPRAFFSSSIFVATIGLLAFLFAS